MEQPPNQVIEKVMYCHLKGLLKKLIICITIISLNQDWILSLDCRNHPKTLLIIGQTNIST